MQSMYNLQFTLKNKYPGQTARFGLFQVHAVQIFPEDWFYLEAADLFEKPNKRQVCRPTVLREISTLSKEATISKLF